MCVAAFLAVYIAWIALTVYCGGLIWIVVMRNFLPISVIRRWVECNSPSIPILSPIWHRLADPLLKEDNPLQRRK